MTDTQPAAGSPSSAAPAWFQELVAPASTTPAPEPVGAAPDPVGAPAPAEPVVTAEADPPEHVTEPEPNPEVEALRREVAEIRAAREELQAERERERQAQADVQRAAAKEEYWQAVEAEAQKLDDDAARLAYYRKAADTLDEQEATYRKQIDEQRAIADAARQFPDHIGREYNLEPWQIEKIRAFQNNPNPMLAGIQMTTLADAYRDMNNDPARAVNRDAALQSLASKAAAEVAASGALATGSATAAAPAPTTPPAKPSAIRPGSPESLSMLASALGMNRQ